VNWVTLLLQILASPGGSAALLALFKDKGIEKADLQKIADALPGYGPPNEGNSK
jgi:hypothetical protein